MTKNELVEENKKLKQEIEDLKKKNNRNAGRKPKLSEKDIENILSLRNMGLTTRVIAEKVGCSFSLVAKIIRERIPNINWVGDFSEDEKQQILQLIKENPNEDILLNDILIYQGEKTEIKRIKYII